MSEELKEQLKRKKLALEIIQEGFKWAKDEQSLQSAIEKAELPIDDYASPQT